MQPASALALVLIVSVVGGQARVRGRWTGCAIRMDRGSRERASTLKNSTAQRFSEFDKSFSDVVDLQGSSSLG